MAHSIEARVPFCDHNVTKTCLEIPIEQNIGKGSEKEVLKQAIRSKLKKR